VVPTLVLANSDAFCGKHSGARKASNPEAAGLQSFLLMVKHFCPVIFCERGHEHMFIFYIYKGQLSRRLPAGDSDSDSQAWAANAGPGSNPVKAAAT
jgi:hypothetical protein